MDPTVASLFESTSAPIPLALIDAEVQAALAEDVGPGDVSADLIAADQPAQAQVICREEAVLCGRTWFERVYAQLSAQVQVQWQVAEGGPLAPKKTVCTLRGPARALLTGERAALNFLQTLSGTATAARRYAEAVRGTRARILDTRKTIPGLRLAQKYAVRCGGCFNHRLGLYDMVLIKENHIASAGSITVAVTQARTLHPHVEIEIEVETLAQLREALAAGTHRILLDNMDLPALREAVAVNAGRALLEASGGVTLDNVRTIAQTGVDFISVGGITKHLHAIDFSMRLAAG